VPTRLVAGEEEESAEDQQPERSRPDGEEVEAAPAPIAAKAPSHREDRQLQRDRAEEVGQAVGIVLPGELARHLAGPAVGVDRPATVGREREAVEDLGEPGEGDQPGSEPAARAAQRGWAIEHECDRGEQEGTAPDRHAGIE
jgi:hypothetical protein